MARVTKCSLKSPAGEFSVQVEQDPDGVQRTASSHPRGGRFLVVRGRKNKKIKGE